MEMVFTALATAHSYIYTGGILIHQRPRHTILLVSDAVLRPSTPNHVSTLGHQCSLLCLTANPRNMSGPVFHIGP
jgi:hypothetical protein